MVITLIPPLWFAIKILFYNFFFNLNSLGLIVKIVFVVIHHFLHSLENIIVGLVVKHFVQHVHQNIVLYLNMVLKRKFEFAYHVMIVLKRKIINLQILINRLFFVIIELVVFVHKLHQTIHQKKKMKLNLMKMMLFN